VTTAEHHHDIAGLADALSLAQLGWRVLPIKPGHKRPPMTAWQNAATSDPATIDNWFRGLYRDHGVGVAPHQLPDGRWMFIIDVDEHHAAASGGDTLHDLEVAHGKLPTTVETLTGSGGRHIYLASPVPITNDAGRRLGPGIDIRGVGGQVLAPPTIHPNGQPYVWVDGCGPMDVEIADAPQWVIDKLTEAPVVPTAPKPRHSIWDDIDDGPAATFNASTTWDELLSADGWALSHVGADGEQHWTRPGKSPREGTSATVGYKGNEALKVFTSSISWLPEGAYSRFGYYACRHHGGDRSQAARTLKGTVSAQVVAAVDPGEPWLEPTPLVEHSEPPAFPIETLPSWISDHCRQVADDLQVAIDLPATLAIGALAVAVLGNSKVAYPRQNWTQPLNIYAAVALPPSAGKSPAKSAMFGALEELELRRISQAAAGRIKAETKRSILEKRKRTLEDKAAKGGDDGRAAEDELMQLIEEIQALDIVPSGRLLADDATTEALGAALADAGGAMAVVSAEGGIFDRISGMYSDTANLDLYLEGWGGGRYVVDRIKREPISIPSANVCVITTVQPAVLDEVGAKKMFAGRGLTARFLLCLPPTNVGVRDRLKQSHGDVGTRRTYESVLVGIADEVADRPVTLAVTGEASDEFAQFDQQMEYRLAPGGDLEHLGEWVGKLRANILRMAALLHLADGAAGDVVDVATIRRALTLGDYFLAHAVSISERWGTDEKSIKAVKLMDWIVRNGLIQFTARDVLRGQRRVFGDIESVRLAVELLMERGWVRPLFDGPWVAQTSRGKPSPAFAVHPEARRHLDQSVSRVSRTKTDEMQEDSETNTQTVDNCGKSVDNYPSEYRKDFNVSRVSRVSRKGGFDPSSLSSETKTSPPPTPGDTRDTRDTLQSFQDVGGGGGGTAVGLELCGDLTGLF
jgi:replicative DNA helicase